MNNIANQLVQLLDSNNADHQEIILRIAFCFENYRGLPKEAWPIDIQLIKINDSEVELLKQTLKDFILTNNNESIQGSAIWAFGKIADKSEIHFLQKLLGSNINGSAQTIYQILCVLDALGENVFLGHGESSVLDSDNNISYAKQYLENLNA